MPVERKGWDSLSSDYRKRLLSNGITKADYSQGRSIAKARGHAATPEHGGWRKKAVAFGITEIVPEFYDDFTRPEQEELSKNWVEGFMSRGKGDVVNPKRKRGEKIKRRASDEQIISRMRFKKFMDDNEGGLGAEFWQDYRESYVRNFSA